MKQNGTAVFGKSDKTVFEVDGQQYTLTIDTDAMIALEDMFSTPDKEVTFGEVFARVQAGSVKHGRAFVWAAMQRYHPNTTLSQAGQLLNHPDFVTQILKLAGMAVVDPADLEALALRKGQTANPPKAQARKRKAGTGGRSTATRGLSA